MNLACIPAKLLPLGAVDFGIVVEGVVVITAAGLRRLDAKPKQPLQKTVFSVEGTADMVGSWIQAVVLGSVVLLAGSLAGSRAPQWVTSR